MRRRAVEVEQRELVHVGDAVLDPGRVELYGEAEFALLEKVVPGHAVVDSRLRLRARLPDEVRDERVERQKKTDVRGRFDGENAQVVNFC